MKMKRVFRRNQIIITTLAIMIAAAGYLNYSGKQELAGADVYEAGSTDLSEEEILAENRPFPARPAKQIIRRFPVWMIRRRESFRRRPGKIPRSTARAKRSSRAEPA